MCNQTFKYELNNITLKNGQSFKTKQINIFVGSNNCGKTQLLRDILSLATAKNPNPIIIENIHTPHPKSWQELNENYPTIISRDSINYYIQHISPTLTDSSIQAAHSQTEQGVNTILNEWLSSAPDEFRYATGPRYITYLNTDNRLRLGMKQTVNLDDSEMSLLKSLFLSDNSIKQKIEMIIKDIFDIDVYLDHLSLGNLQYRIGCTSSNIPSDPYDGFNYLKQYPILDTQGDGLRSVLGIICAIIGINKPIILLDEPEAFLHPPQAYQLGKHISNIINNDQQLFIATHSADFLKGLLEKNNDLNIIRITRNKNQTNITQLNSNTLKNITTSPLLSSCRVLDGMFYKASVITEADSDAIFYNRLFQKISSSDEIHFINAHNKQTLNKIAQPYKEIGIKCAMIADIDIIRDKSDMNKILTLCPDATLKNTIMQNQEIVYNYFQNADKTTILSNTLNELSQLITTTQYNSQNSTAEEQLNTVRSKLKHLRDDSDVFKELKKKGITAISDDKIKAALEQIITDCQQFGLFIVPVGELESWLTEYGISRTEKHKWILAALNALPTITYEPEKLIWKFMDSLKTYLTG